GVGGSGTSSSVAGCSVADCSAASGSGVGGVDPAAPGRSTAGGRVAKGGDPEGSAANGGAAGGGEASWGADTAARLASRVSGSSSSPTMAPIPQVSATIRAVAEPIATQRRRQWTAAGSGPTGSHTSRSVY